MAGGLLFGCLVPHPPVLLPEVGRDMAREVEPTVEALKELGQKIASYEPETLVLISPHGPLLRDSMAIGLAPKAEGDFAPFEAPQVKLSVPCDVELATAIQVTCERVAVTVTAVDSLTKPSAEEQVYWLDHGAAVPLHFLLPFLADVRVVLLGYSWLPRATHKAFGTRIRQACEDSGRRVVFVASGDLSHRLIPTAPAGYDPQGRVFDEEVIAAVAGGDWDRIRNMPAELVDRAGVCGYNSILTLAGAMGDRVNTRVLCYQGPYGVGYLTAEVESQEGSPSPAVAMAAEGQETPASAKPMIDDIRQGFAFDDAPFGQQLLRLARQSLETYVNLGVRPRFPSLLPPEFGTQQACFVTLRQAGKLRGCVGTIEPLRDHLAAEIVENAIGAGTRDYRFYGVEATELSQLAYSVDVLSPLERVDHVGDMDPERYGMVVRRDGHVGVLLPGIPEITTVQQQLETCCQKAGIDVPDNLELFRFTVTRFAEPGAEH